MTIIQSQLIRTISKQQIAISLRTNMTSSFPNPRRLLVSNQANGRAEDQAEPGVEVLVDTLEPVAVMPQFNRAPIATHTVVPTSNTESYVFHLISGKGEGHVTNHTLIHVIPRSGRSQLDTVPGSGIVMPGGANIYYLDLAPHSESPMVRAIPTLRQHTREERETTG